MTFKKGLAELSPPPKKPSLRAPRPSKLGDTLARVQPHGGQGNPRPQGGCSVPTLSQLGHWGWGKAGRGTVRLVGIPSLPGVAALGEAADGYWGGVPPQPRKGTPLLATEWLPVTQCTWRGGRPPPPQNEKNPRLEGASKEPPQALPLQG